MPEPMESPNAQVAANKPQPAIVLKRLSMLCSPVIFRPLVDAPETFVVPLLSDMGRRKGKQHLAWRLLHYGPDIQSFLHC